MRWSHVVLGIVVSTCLYVQVRSIGVYALTKQFYMGFEEFNDNSPTLCARLLRPC